MGVARNGLAWALGLMVATCIPRSFENPDPIPESQAATPPTPPSVFVFAHREQSRRLRGDWEPPQTLLVAYEENWPDVLGEIVAAARPDTNVVVVLNPSNVTSRDVSQWLRSLDVQTVVVGHDSPWIRDYGPFELHDEWGSQQWIDMAYDVERPLDDDLPEQLGYLAGVAVERQALYLDGGGLISNGAGHCAMTEASFLAFAGTSELDTATAAIEELGCEVLTVVPALSKEETGHIDLIAQFLSPHVVAVAEIDATQRPDDAHVLDSAVRLLQAGAEQLGQSLRVVRVPLVVRGNTYFSYINGTRLKDTFLVPAYLGVPESVESLAYRRLLSGLPDNVALASVFADDVAELGGAIHCVTLGLSARVALVPDDSQPGSAPDLVP